ncbi:hypothetical protein B0H13DRAFT_1882138 [Mycena leptocephala]|nr:hypothetical protein B0H13DRAFT_1882138 [Mycena leptocephala]
MLSRARTVFLRLWFRKPSPSISFNPYCLGMGTGTGPGRNRSTRTRTLQNPYPGGYGSKPDPQMHGSATGLHIGHLGHTWECALDLTKHHFAVSESKLSEWCRKGELSVPAMTRQPAGRVAGSSGSASPTTRDPYPSGRKPGLYEAVQKFLLLVHIRRDPEVGGIGRDSWVGLWRHGMEGNTKDGGGKGEVNTGMFTHSVQAPGDTGSSPVQGSGLVLH